MEKTVYITEKEREMCYKVIGAFAELYEMEDEDILVVDVGRYGLLNCSAIHRHMALKNLTPIQTAIVYLKGFGRNGLV